MIHGSGLLPPFAGVICVQAAQGEMEDADRYLQQIEKRYAAKRL